MSVMNTLVFFVIGSFVFLNAEGASVFMNATGNGQKSDVETVLPLKFKVIYEQIESSDERAYFLLYHLARGFSIMERKFPLGFYPITRSRCHKTLKVPDDLDIPDELVVKFEEMDLPESESEALYRWVSSSFKIHVERRVKLRQNVVCFPSGSCIDLDDVGSHCCPF